MPLDEQDRARLLDMLDAVQQARRLAAATPWEVYRDDRNAQMIVERLLEIVGEAARNVSKPLQAECHEIPWRKIIAQRHILAHEYGAIRHDLLWRVVNERLPELEIQIEQILKENPSP